MATEPQEASSAYERATERRVTILETRFDTILPMLATKADLAELKAEFNAKLSDTKTELKADIARVEVNLTKWLLRITISMIVGFGGMIVALFNMH